MGKNKHKNVKSSAKQEFLEQQRQKRRRMNAVKDILLLLLITGVVIGGFIGLLFAAGVFDYHPQVTADILITIENYGSLHIELYGNDAPETVENFLSLVNKGYYNGKSIFKLADDLAYMGSETASATVIKGEFKENGFSNKISHKRGTLSMVRSGEGNSDSSQFFIVKKDSPELNGKYAAFGKVTDGMEVIDSICKDIKTDENGNIAKEDQPKITSISTHAPHNH